MLKKNALLIAAFAFCSYTTQAQFTKPQKKASAKAETSIGIKSEEKFVELMGEVSIMAETPLYNPLLLRTGIYHAEKKSNEGIQIPPDQLPAYIEDGKNF